MIYTTVFFHFYKCKLPEARRSETSKKFIGDSLKKRKKAMGYYHLEFVADKALILRT